jgi:hypothetical protein
MKRVTTLVALAVLSTGPLAATNADAFFAGRSARSTSASASANTLGLRADQLKVGTKRWFEQMEREGRFGGTRG